VQLVAWLDERVGGDFWNLRVVEADSIAELFGAVEARESTLGALSLPPRIAGPVTHFYRLDVDGDGYVTGSDLSRLESPLQLGVRASAVLAALDRDGDGRLSEAEVLASLQSQPRAER
jgi:hypothetical protein